MKIKIIVVAALLAAGEARAAGLASDLEALQRRAAAMEDAAARRDGAVADRSLSSYLGELRGRAAEGPEDAGLAREAAGLRGFVDARWTEEDEVRQSALWRTLAEKVAALGEDGAAAFSPRGRGDDAAFGELSSLAGMLSAAAPAPGIAERIALAADGAPAAAGEGTLYGFQTWTNDTKRTIAGMSYPGMLSCAIVVSAILNKAGRGIGRHYGVDDVRSALGGWKTIGDESALERGDVVFWKATRLKAELLWKLGHYPRGQYPQHVGVYVGKDFAGRRTTVDNNSLTGKPERQTLSRWGNDFNGARRAR